MNDEKTTLILPKTQYHPCEDEEKFLNLVAEIMVEIILKEEKNERDRYANAQEYC